MRKQIYNGSFFTGSLIAMILLLTSSCKIGQISKDFKSIKEDASKISKDIKSVKGAFTPIDSATMAAMSGVLTELSDTISETKMDTIAARINRILVSYLNESFKNLDPGPLGQHLAQGAMQPILDPATEQRLQEMIHSVSQKASDDLTTAMRNMMSELTSRQSQAKLNTLLVSLLNDSNSDALAGFVNRSIDKVNFDTIGHRIAYELIETNVKPQVDSVVRMAVRSIFSEIQKDKNAKGFFSDIRNIMLLGIGLLGLAMAVLFWINRRKAMDLNRMFIHAIEDMEEKHATDAKKAVENQARQRGLLANMDRIMKKESIRSRKEKDDTGG